MIATAAAADAATRLAAAHPVPSLSTVLAAATSALATRLRIGAMPFTSDLL
jgi:hypothetical protein